jgi:Arc/MetJ-type ribon-helix-helix transcriptional regulator
MMKNHRSISVPKKLVDEIERMLKDDLCMYTSKADFIIDAIRRHLEKTKEQIIDERRHKEHLETIIDKKD